MILICSDVNEPTTDIVCNWLTYFKKKFVRISRDNIISFENIHISSLKNDIKFKIDDKSYNLSDFNSYWYRRSRLNYKKLDCYTFNHEGEDLTMELKIFLKQEYEKMIEFFEFKISEIAKLNTFQDNYINKLQTLNLAMNLGISIPSTTISRHFNQKFIDNDKYITKPISDLLMEKNGKSYFSTTKRVEKKDFKEIHYSLVQNEVNKQFEIRSFYFNNQFFSSVIFSQENPKTELDFRNYDHENPNRVVPFKLPEDLEYKLAKLCHQLNLKSGSFDIAYTKNNEYVLFEVNPVGQFEQVSFPCNYKLHKRIAEYL